MAAVIELALSRFWWHPLVVPADAYMAEAGVGRRPAAEVKSLVAATAFDDFFRAQNAAESSGASLG